MVECDYCGQSFDDEDAYLDHLAATHEGELSTIDARRVDDRNPEESGISAAPLILAGVLLVGVVMVVYIAVVGFGNSGDGPGPTGSAHEHGTITVMINGEPLNLAQDQYIFADDNFHLDGPEDQIEEDLFVWHVHAEGVTLKYALETFGMEVASDGSEVTFQGTTYSEDDPDTELVLEVDGESVDPGEYELDGSSVQDARQGNADHVRLVLNSTAS